jgi:hypothetical protein
MEQCNARQRNTPPHTKQFSERVVVEGLMPLRSSSTFRYVRSGCPGFGSGTQCTGSLRTQENPENGVPQYPGIVCRSAGCLLKLLGYTHFCDLYCMLKVVFYLILYISDVV